MEMKMTWMTCDQRREGSLGEVGGSPGKSWSQGTRGCDQETRVTRDLTRDCDLDWWRMCCDGDTGQILESESETYNISIIQHYVKLFYRV